MALSLHPSIDNGLRGEGFRGRHTCCRCTSNQVNVALKGNVLFNHACGCTKCWKPAGAMFSVVAVISKNNVNVTANGNKLKIVDPSAAIQQLCLHRLRRAHVRPHREDRSRLLRPRLRACRAVEGAGLVAAAVRRVRVLRHRRWWREA